MVTSEVKVGDEFIYVTPSGKEHRYRVVELDFPTRQGQRMPRATPLGSGVTDVFIHDELLAQNWWRPVEAER